MRYNSKVFDKIIVSSDNRKILNIAKKFGAETPFLRPSSISKNNTTTIEVVKHTIKWLLNRGHKINYVLHLSHRATYDT